MTSLEVLGFKEPSWWPFDGDLRRKEPVIDLDGGGRVLRHVDYRRCLICRHPFFTANVARNRICDNTSCKHASEG